MCEDANMPPHDPLICNPLCKKIDGAAWLVSSLLSSFVTSECKIVDLATYTMHRDSVIYQSSSST